MNIFLGILQILVALHTAIGAVWKFANTAEQTMPSLKMIPHGVWLAMGAFEIVLSACLILPLVYKPWALLAPIAAACIAVEMLVFSGLHFYSGDRTVGPVIYWLVVAAICGFIAYSRTALVAVPA